MSDNISVNYARLTHSHVTHFGLLLNRLKVVCFIISEKGSTRRDDVTLISSPSSEDCKQNKGDKTLRLAYALKDKRRYALAQ